MSIIDIRFFTGSGFFAHFWLIALMCAIGWTVSQTYKKIYSTFFLRRNESFFKDGSFPSSHCCVLTVMFFLLIKEAFNYINSQKEILQSLPQTYKYHFMAIAAMIMAITASIGIFAALFFRDSFGSRYTIKKNAIATRRSIKIVQKVLEDNNLISNDDSKKISIAIKSIKTESGHRLYESIGGGILGILIDSVFYMPWLISLLLLALYFYTSTKLLNIKYKRP